MNWLPIVSQLKSLVQACDSDYEGARDTQVDFVETCPIVSQITSAVQAAQGDSKSARETQVKFVHMVGRLLNSMPGVGFVKAIVHYASTDHEGGDQAIKACSRTIGVIGCASVGYYLENMFGATVGGIVGGLLMDAITSGAEFIIHGDFIPNATFKILSDIQNDREHRAGHLFDLVLLMTIDAITGFGTGVGNEEAVKSINA